MWPLKIEIRWHFKMGPYQQHDAYLYHYRTEGGTLGACSSYYNNVTCVVYIKNNNILFILKKQWSGTVQI